MSTLIVIIAISLLVLWGTTLYLWWREETGNPVAPLTAPVIARKIDQCIRICRRGWYSSCRIVDTTSRKTGSYILNILLRIAPRLEQVLTRKDALTGLKHGPSSYFLMTISEKKAPSKKVAQ